MTKDWHTPEQIVSELGKMRNAYWEECANVHVYVVVWVDIGPIRLWMIRTELQILHEVSDIIRASCDRREFRGRNGR